MSEDTSNIEALLKALAEVLIPHVPVTGDGCDGFDFETKVQEIISCYDFTDVVESVIDNGCVVGDQIQREIQDSGDILSTHNVEEMISDAINNLEVEITRSPY